MPTLTMTFKNLGLVVHQPGSSRHLMLRANHRAELETRNGFKKTLTGEVVTIREKDGATLSGPSIRPTDRRLVQLKNIVGPDVALKSDAEIAGLINADVRMPAGTWFELEPEIRVQEFERFRNERWAFKDASGNVVHRQMLTNAVKHESSLESGKDYQLLLDGAAVEDFTGDRDYAITIVNQDTDNGGIWDGVLSDFELVYDLVTTDTGVFPTVNQTSDVINPGAGFNRPMCGKGQIG